MFNVKGVAHSNEPTKNYHLSLQFLSTLRGVFCTACCFGFTAHDFAVFVHLLPAIMRSDTPTVCYITAPKTNRETISNQLVSIMEHLAAKKTDTFPEEKESLMRMNIGLPWVVMTTK